eukprot:Hpha_TRINITY_DN15571_c2_g8::TRINITY_DN15571_c2_g8_i1::g.106258::m.106258
MPSHTPEFLRTPQAAYAGLLLFAAAAFAGVSGDNLKIPKAQTIKIPKPAGDGVMIIPVMAILFVFLLVSYAPGIIRQKQGRAASVAAEDSDDETTALMEGKRSAYATA